MYIRTIVDALSKLGVNSHLLDSLERIINGVVETMDYNGDEYQEMLHIQYLNRLRQLYNEMKSTTLIEQNNKLKEE